MLLATTSSESSICAKIEAEFRLSTPEHSHVAKRVNSDGLQHQVNTATLASIFSSLGFGKTQKETRRLGRESNRLSMSESVQQSRQKYRGSKFWEGRLKLSTSCTECHRRKQKVRYPSFILCNGWKVTSGEAILILTLSVRPTTAM